MGDLRRACPNGHEAKLVTGREIYPHRSDLFAKPFWACLPCGAWTGCHPGTEKRMGRLANAETRRLKMAAHAAFDPLWKSGGLSRTKAYAWLRAELALSERDCHIGWMSDDDLRRVVDVCNALLSDGSRCGKLVATTHERQIDQARGKGIVPEQGEGDRG